MERHRPVQSKPTYPVFNPALTSSVTMTQQPRILAGGGTAHLAPVKTDFYEPQRGRVASNTGAKLISSSAHRPTVAISQPYPIPATQTNQLLLAPTILRPQIYTSPRLSVVSDKQIQVVGSYVSHQPKKGVSIHEVSTAHTPQPISAKVVQTTIKDVIPTQVIKINSEGVRQSGRLSQVEVFGAPSVGDFGQRLNGASHRSIYGSTANGNSSKSLSLGGRTTLLSDNIKVSVYRSPDVIIKQPQLITQGPTLQKQHVLRVGVQGRVIPTYRHLSNQVELRQMPLLNRQETIIHHEARLAPELLTQGSTTVSSKSYEIKPSVTQVVAPSVTTVLGAGYQNPSPSYSMPRAATNIVPSHNEYSSDNTSPEIRAIMMKTSTPARENVGRMDESIIQSLTSNPGGELNSIESSRHNYQPHVPQRFNESNPLGLSYKMAIEPTQISPSKLPQSKIVQPLAFHSGQVKLTQNQSFGGGSRPEGMYKGPPLRVNDPQRLLLD